MTASGDLADQVIAYAGELGYSLDEWQKQTIRAWYAGQLTQRSRRSGVTTLRRVIQAYETDHPSPPINRLSHRCDDRCICPIHSSQMIYHRPSEDHACRDPECIYAHGMKTHGQHNG